MQLFLGGGAGGMGRRDQGFNFDCIAFEMPTRYPTGDVKQLVKGDSQAGVIHLEVGTI